MRSSLNAVIVPPKGVMAYWPETLYDDTREEPLTWKRRRVLAA